MKTTDFINTYTKEGVDPNEYNDEAPMIKNDLHTIVRVSTHLNKALGEHENLPVWVIEKIAQTKGMIVSVMDYMISQHEMGQKEEVPGFDADQAEQMFESVLAEETLPWETDQEAREREAGRKEKSAFKKPNNPNRMPRDTVKALAQKGIPKSNKPAVVKTNKPIGTRVADIGPGGKEHNVKTDKEWRQQQSRDAFNNMMGGGNPTKNLKIKEAPTDDPKFQKMMGAIQKNTPDPVSGYVAVSYASERPSKKIRGATVNGRALPATTDDPGQLIKDLKFTPDRIEQQLTVIGQKYGWDLVEPGQGQGYTDVYFDTNKEFTTHNQKQLAAMIVKTVAAINKYFSDMNRSLQATGLPGYQTNVWQGMGSNGNIRQIDDINKIAMIAQGKTADSDAGPAIGRMILKYIPEYEAENDELGYDPKDFANAKKVASIYIAKGEQAGLQAQLKLSNEVSDMIDELLSDHGGSNLRTISSDGSDEDQLNELSVGPKIRAYASRSDHAHDAGYSGDDEEEEIQSAKANKIRSNIQKKHGDTAAQHADRAATSKIAGRFHMQPVKEDATAGASGSSSVAVTMETLGSKGGFTKSDVHKKITGYSNMMSRGGPVKAKR